LHPTHNTLSRAQAAIRSFTVLLLYSQPITINFSEITDSGKLLIYYRKTLSYNTRCQLNRESGGVIVLGVIDSKPSTAALVDNGRIVSAISEERL
jgi:hypothetical protein